jgi:hypothetical protein
VDFDPSDGSINIGLIPPAGGWRWETSGSGTFPQTVYGFSVFDGDSGEFYGCELLDEPIQFTAINQSLYIPEIKFRISAGAMT